MFRSTLKSKGLVQNDIVILTVMVKRELGLKKDYSKGINQVRTTGIVGSYFVRTYPRMDLTLGTPLKRPIQLYSIYK